MSSSGGAISSATLLPKIKERKVGSHKLCLLQVEFGISSFQSVIISYCGILKVWGAHSNTRGRMANGFRRAWLSKIVMTGFDGVLN